MMTLSTHSPTDTAATPPTPWAPPASLPAYAAATWQQARRLVLRYGYHTTSYATLNPGIAHWFAADGQSVVGYVAHAGVRLVAGEPVCPPEQLPAVLAAFEADAAADGQQVCYCAAENRLLHTLRQMRPTGVLLLGAQPVWQAGAWHATIRGKSSLRAQLARACNKGVQVQPWQARQVADSAALREVLEQWLASRRIPALGFLVEPNLLDAVADRRAWVATRDDAVQGFVLAAPIPLRRGWYIEHLIRQPTAPNGTADLLLDAAVRDLAASGAEHITLGLSPLSQRADVPAYPTALWLRLLLAWLRAHGHRFYNFEGLDAFKARFLPAAWEPVYALASTPQITPRMVYALATALSYGHPLRLLASMVGRAARQEVQIRRYAAARATQQG